MSKKTIIISASAVGIIIILSIAAFFIFRKAPESATTTQNGNNFPTGQGTGGGGKTPTGGGGDGGTPTGQPKRGASFFHITNGPTSGFTIIKTASSTDTLVRYVDKSTGHIYKTDAEGKSNDRVSNATILKTIGSSWSPDGNKVALSMSNGVEGAETIQFFSGIISSTTNQLVGTFLPTETMFLTSSPKEDLIFYLGNDSGNSRGFVSEFDRKTRKTVIDGVVGEVNGSWVNKSIITLNTKPSGKIDGFFYAINVATKELERILGDIKGLIAVMSPTEEYVLFSDGENDGVDTKILSLKTYETKTLGIKTLAEKCVWSIKNKDVAYCAVPKTLGTRTLPDDWYLGLVSFEDEFWRLDFANENYEKIVDSDFDVTDLQIDSKDKYILFTNKKDLSLWSLRFDEAI